MLKCKDCYWYSIEHRTCVKHNQFEFETMPICDDFKQNDDQFK